MAADDDNAMLIPQQLAAWTPDTDKANANKGAYLAVKVNITTKAGARVYPVASVGEYDWAAVAIGTNWEPGKNTFIRSISRTVQVRSTQKRTAY